MENGSVEGRIVDAQGMLNVNNLADGDQTVSERQRFERLFERAPHTAGDPRGNGRLGRQRQHRGTGGAEDAWYGRMAQPGLAANMPAVRIDELAAVRGVNPRCSQR